MMDVVSASKTSANFCETTWCNTSADSDYYEHYNVLFTKRTFSALIRKLSQKLKYWLFEAEVFLNNI
jgi:hypothetical protein